MSYRSMKLLDTESNDSIDRGSEVSSMQNPMRDPMDQSQTQIPAVASALTLAQIAGIGHQPTGYTTIAATDQSLDDSNQRRYQPFYPLPQPAIQQEMNSGQMPSPMGTQEQSQSQPGFNDTLTNANNAASQHPSSSASGLAQRKLREAEKYNRMMASDTAKVMTKPCRVCRTKQQNDSAHTCVYDPTEGSLCANCVVLHRPCIFDEIDEEELNFRLQGKNGEIHDPNSSKRYRSSSTAPSASRQGGQNIGLSLSPARAQDSPTPAQDFDWGSIVINPESLPSYIFYCGKCGVRGHNFADGHYQVACNTCAVRQHAICHGIREEQIADANFRFLCGGCRRREGGGGGVTLGPNVYHAT